MGIRYVPFRVPSILRRFEFKIIAVLPRDLLLLASDNEILRISLWLSVHLLLFSHRNASILTFSVSFVLMIFLAE